MYIYRERTFIFILCFSWNLLYVKRNWRRKWQPTPVILPREFHEQRSLADYSPWGCKESGMTEQLSLPKGIDQLILYCSCAIFYGMDKQVLIQTLNTECSLWFHLSASTNNASVNYTHICGYNTMTLLLRNRFQQVGLYSLFYQSGYNNHFSQLWLTASFSSSCH